MLLNLLQPRDNRKANLLASIALLEHVQPIYSVLCLGHGVSLDEECSGTDSHCSPGLYERYFIMCRNRAIVDIFLRRMAKHAIVELYNRKKWNTTDKPTTTTFFGRSAPRSFARADIILKARSRPTRMNTVAPFATFFGIFNFVSCCRNV